MNEIQIMELNRIKTQNGGLLSPEKVLHEAEKTNNPLHNFFTWDDSVAAHQYRLEQARQMIRVCVTVIDGHPEPVRMFVSLKNDRHPDGGYRSTIEILDSQELREQLLQDALYDLKQLQRKYKNLSELVKVFEEVNKFADSVQQKIKA